jgi:hypothetical protein
VPVSALILSQNHECVAASLFSSLFFFSLVASIIIAVSAKDNNLRTPLGRDKSRSSISGTRVS